MCGIYASTRPHLDSEVRQRLASIAARGPDHFGLQRHGEVVLAHLRLAIVDLDARANQPLSFGQLHIVYNGEIYNHGVLREELAALGHVFTTTSDTEVLLKGYAAWGAAMLPRLNGMFAFAIYDASKREFFCARDRLGVKPFYYAWQDGHFELCSQLGPLINHDSELCDEAIATYLDCGYVPSPLSILKGVFKLPPGHFMVIDVEQRRRQLEPYWELSPAPGDAPAPTYDEAQATLKALLIDTVKIRLQADVPVGVFLSGGIDSALVAALAAHGSSHPINTFTIAFDDPAFDESAHARRVAVHLGTNHHEETCSAADVSAMIPTLSSIYDEPFADSSALPSLVLNKLAKRHVTVALAGDGGDESFFGYNHFDLLTRFMRVASVPHAVRRKLALLPWRYLASARPDTIPSMLRIRDAREFALKTFAGYASLLASPPTPRDLAARYGRHLQHASDPVQQLADLNIKLWLEGDSNVKVDRASMAASVEVRSPLLDYRLIEYARTLPVAYRYHRGVRKRILRDILATYVPRDLFEAPKRGFAVPLGQWIRGELAETFRDTLSPAFLQSLPGLDLATFHTHYAWHMAGRYDYSFSIWKLYVLAQWMTYFRYTKGLRPT